MKAILLAVVPPHKDSSTQELIYMRLLHTGSDAYSISLRKEFSNVDSPYTGDPPCKGYHIQGLSQTGANQHKGSSTLE